MMGISRYSPKGRPCHMFRSGTLRSILDLLRPHVAFLVLKGLVHGIGEFLESNKFSFQGVKVSNFGSAGLVF
jgi:hypothetical protein